MLNILKEYLVAKQGLESIFRASGKGIVDRSKKFKLHWAVHIERCMDAQARWARLLEDVDSISVIGAGHLHDVALEDLQERFSSFHLYDADPSCLQTWHKSKRHFPHITLHDHLADFSNDLDRWRSWYTNSIRNEGWDGALNILGSCEGFKTSTSAFANNYCQALLSINTLSQIPVYWRHLVENILKRKFGSKKTAQRESEWLEAFSPSAKLLLERHIRDLATHPAEHALLISDICYLHYYGNVSYSLLPDRPSPFIARDRGWCLRPEFENKISKVELIDALYGIDLLTEIKRYRDTEPKMLDQWIWHIAPKGCAEISHGEAHLVHAFQF